jgi:hypothetical protein
MRGNHSAMVRHLLLGGSIQCVAPRRSHLGLRRDRMDMMG